METLILPVGPYNRPPYPPGNPTPEDKPRGCDGSVWAREKVWLGVRFAPKITDHHYFFTPPNWDGKNPDAPMVRIEWSDAVTQAPGLATK